MSIEISTIIKENRKMASKTLRLDRNLLPKTTIQKQINSRARKAYAQVRNNNNLNLVNVKTNRYQQGLNSKNRKIW